MPARDIGHAARVLRRSLGLTLLSIATMGVGIGATAVLLTLVHAVLLRPLPYPEPDRLVRIFDTNPEAGVDRAGAASGNIDDWRLRTPAFDGIAGYYAMGRTLSTDAGSDVLIAAQVSRDFFPLLRVPPQLGRTFADDDIAQGTFSSAAAPTGSDPAVILSDGVWRGRFGADPAIVGRSITLERRSFRVVGVMPDSFAMPDGGVDLWIPWDLSGDRPRDQHYLGAIGRLAPGVSLTQAEGQLAALARELGAEHPETNRGWSVQLSPLHAETVGDAAPALWVLLGAVALVLLVSCANAALLGLMRGLDRAGETAIRLALGASAGRLRRESLIESTLLATLGGGLGVVVAQSGLAVLPRVAGDLPRLTEVMFDVRTALVIMALTAVSAALVGMPQAWRRARVAPAGSMMLGSARTTGDRPRHLLRDAIVVGQVALAVVLMIGSGLLVRSFLFLRGADTGFESRGVLVAPVFLDSQAYDSGEKSRAYYRTLFERLAAVPGVSAVGGATTVPTSPLGPDFERPVWPIEAPPDSALRMPASVRIVTPGYFAVLELRVAEGRAFDETDQPASPSVIMVNETLARRLWPGERPVGRRLVVDYSTAGTYPYEVVGVVGDVRFAGPRSAPAPEIYLPHAQRSYLVQNVVVKTQGDPRALIATVRRVLHEIDPQKPAHGIQALTDLVGATYAREREAMVTLLVFAAMAIFLSVLSVYAVLAQRVRERTREIGIRMAIGASPLNLVAWVGRVGARLFATGALMGLVIAWWLAGSLGGLLFGVAPHDPLITVTTLVLLALVGLAATLVPSWRATRVDPVSSLRCG